jgi:hypothetical protein
VSAPIGVGHYQRGCPSRPGLFLIIAHLCWALVESLRASDRDLFIVGRFDQGRDGEQLPLPADYLAFADEAALVKHANAAADGFFDGRIAPVVRARPGVFWAALGPNEAIPGRPKRGPGQTDAEYQRALDGYRAALRWRAAVELRLCRRVQGELGIAYIWGAINVGTIDAEDVLIFLAVWREAWGVNYHAYLAPGRKSIAEEIDDWHVWRPFAIWLPVLRANGVRLRLFVGELGPFYPELRGDDLARCQVEIHRAIRARAAREGVEYVGSCAYGAGMMGDQEAWEVEPSIPILVAANAEDGATAPSRPVLSAPAQPPVPKEQAKVSTKHLRLALVPSCQGNRTVDGSTEAELMHGLARAIRDVAAQYDGVEVQAFEAATETDTVNLPNLTGQITRAKAWLDAAPAGTATVTLHLHSDALYAGDNPQKGHVVAMHSNEDISKRLAGRIGDLLGRLFYGVRVDVVNGEARGLRAFTMSRGAHCVEYLECGVHELPAHVRIIREQGSTIGREIVEAILRFLSLPVSRRIPISPTSALNWAEIGLYSQWGQARVAAREDPRDRAAFTAHVAALGGDAKQLSRYGWPG